MPSLLQRIGAVVFFGMMVISLAGGCCFGGSTSASVPEVEPPSVEPAIEPVVPPAAAIDPASLDTLAVASAGSPVVSSTLDRASFEALARGRVPQIPGGARLFEEARPHDGGPLEGAVLVCRTMMVPGHDDWDGPFGGPELELRARVGSGPLRRTGEGRPAGLFTLPVARLAPGEHVWMRLVDRDVLYDDPIGEGSTRFAGATPLVISMRTATIECRAIEGERVEEVARPALGRIDFALEQVERARPDVTEAALGYPTSDAIAVRREASATAAWIDWSNSRVEERIARASRFEAAWSIAAREEVARAERELPPPEATAPVGSGRHARILEIACGTAAVRVRGSVGDALAQSPGEEPCVARVAIDNGAHSWALPRLDVHSMAPLTFEAIDAEGHVQRTSWIARGRGATWAMPAEQLEIAPRETLELVLALPTRDARIFRVVDEHGHAWVVRAR